MINLSKRLSMGGLFMYRKLDSDAWKEYLSKFNSIKDTITVKDFCVENNLNKSQFYYHKKRLEKVELEKSQPIFHEISLETKDDYLEENIATLKEVKINIGNANITIPVSETTLIATIIRELVLKC